MITTSISNVHLKKASTMNTTIKGHYKNGVVTLEETPQIEEAEVLVTFKPIQENNGKSPRFGYGKGTFGKLPPDFDEPLEDLKDYM